MSEELKLQQRIIDELTFDPAVNAAHIGVSVRGGVVALTGHVESYREKRAAERAARRVKGVTGVAEELEVRLPSDKKTADDEIAQRAVKMIEWNVALPPGTIQVKVEHGHVTLKGTVDWDYQRVAAEYDVLKLNGVKSVMNELAIKPQIELSDIRDKLVAAFERNANIEAHRIAVKVAGSKVTLSGNVNSWIERQEAERAAWSVLGVTSVEDKIVIVRP